MSDRIAVVGAGVAGMAAALFLARAGRGVDLYERFETAGPVGAGFLLQPTGMGVLHALGLYEQVRAQGARIDRLYGETTGQKRVVDLAYADLRPGYYGLGAHRGVVFQALYDAVARTPDIRLRTGVEVDGVVQDAQAARLVTPQGESEPYALVVAADGVNSALRKALGAAARETAYEWACVWAIAADPGGQLDGAFAAMLDQRYEGVERFAGILPIGRAPEAPERAGAALFWSLRAREFGGWRRRGLNTWKFRLHGFWPRFAAFAEQIQDPDQFTLAVYRDVRMERPDHGRVVFVGDAGHAMSPQLGQGANLALLDAMTLAAALDQEADLAAALARFGAARRSQTAWYRLVSRWLTPLFQSSNRRLAILRDLFFWPLNRFPPTRREMLTAQAGLKTGWFTADRRDWTPGAPPPDPLV